MKEDSIHKKIKLKRRPKKQKKRKEKNDTEK